MGLLDTILGAAGGTQRGAAHPLDAILGGLGGGHATGDGGGLNLAALLPLLAPIVSQLLANNGSHGGLSGLAQRFDQAGLGDVLGSWVGSGQNRPIHPDQLTQVLGGDTIGQIAQQLDQIQRELSELIRLELRDPRVMWPDLYRWPPV